MAKKTKMAKEMNEDEGSAQDEAEDRKEDEGEDETEKAEDGEDEDEAEAEKAKKSKTRKSDDLTADDLEKSLARLVSLAGSGDAVSRKAFLLEKAQGASLTKSEQAELFNILGGGHEEAEESLGDRVTKGMRDNDQIKKALDVSEYLDEQHREALGAFTALSDHIEKSDSRQHEFNLVLARAVAETGKLIKAVSERLGVISDQPARGPKSMGLRALEKGFGGQAPAGQQLSKSMVQDELEKMIRESVDRGMNGATENGIDLVNEASKYEQTNKLHPAIAAEVATRIQGTARA